MKGFIMFFFAILLGIAVICGANSAQVAASSSLGIKDHASLRVTSLLPQHNLRQSNGHESVSSSSSSTNNDHLYRQLEYYDFTNITTEQLGAAEVGFLVAILIIVVFLLLLCCCCCGGGRRGGGCSVCDILAAICIWEMCCDQRDPTDFCLV
jgi:hypothetical protein